eukprot:COSAG06_NODE_48801_length_329_cov_1.121739_1_plen_53_part_10
MFVLIEHGLVDDKWNPPPCRFLPVAATVEAESAGCFLPAENALPAQLLLRVSR